MAPKTAPELVPEAEEDAHAGGQSPTNLDTLERTGAIRFGRRIARVILIYEDGRRVAADLPTPAPTRAGKDWAKTKTGRAILDVLSREGRAMKGATIAKLADLEYSGSFRQTLKGLADAGEIDHDPQEQVYGLVE